MEYKKGEKWKLDKLQELRHLPKSMFSQQVLTKELEYEKKDKSEMCVGTETSANQET